MKKKISERINIPQGISCSYYKPIFKCSNNSVELKRKIEIPQVTLKIENSQVVLECERGNKNTSKIIVSFLEHVRNMFSGLSEKFVYTLESANIHFPITFKVEKGELVINNFLGEKVPRHAKILPGVEVELKGNKIIVSSHDIEAAGQTAANFERATKVGGRDRRVYQDGLYIVEKPARRKKDEKA